ncbi:hypothetical protein K2Z83_12355 [Oscillochloris sp. ZM17-4]|uniref:DUF7847 domain-containing protein n=1 Tax=Oscillochloris sp. ZM17-4 TaxID=2866714 RepID=UPI001C73DBEB|nr:hypothetical protein [Oscillochloris sp. ZM17-4]MBX0328469.1 hypothetical protein [Oscillochloris sp. ZM17-4]
MSVAKPQSPGLVDTLSAGYRALHRRLWVALIPAGLSAYLWLGRPLALGGASSSLSAGVRAAAEALGGSPQARQSLADRITHSDMRLSLAWLNLTPVLAPSGASGQSAVAIGGPLQLLGVFALINGLALLWSSLFLTVLGGAVGGEPFAIWPALQRSLRVAGHIALALLIVLGVGLLLGLPFLAISGIIIATLPAAALPVALAWYIACFWAYVYAGFAPEAILISRSGPLRALYHSVNIVRRNLMGAIGLLLLSFIIASGLGVLWRQIAVSPLGIAAAILGSAYVGSGLSAARLEFYRDQAARWRG